MATSTLSRRASLIQKNTAPQGPNELRPSDLLLDRFVAWKSLVKQLIQYFEGIADIENNTANALLRLGGVIQVPFREGHQFMGEGGLQDVYYKLRDGARAAADSHSSLGRTVDSSIVQHLVKLKTEIKAHIKNIQQDTGRLATAVAKERELSVKAISDLSKAITVAKNTPMHVTVREDPYIANTIVTRQLDKQVNEENALQKSIIIMQNNSATFEEGIVRSIQSAWQTFDEWQSRASVAVQESWRHMASAMATVVPDAEWVAFAARADHLLDPETPLRRVDHIIWPGKEDPSIVAIHDGMLERKRRFTKSYHESYYVLTPAGYLHEYKSSDPTQAQHPTFSLFLLACTLGPAAGPNSKSHKFHIELKANDKSGLKAITNRDQAFTFRARSRPEMLSWWNDLRMLCARSLIASEELDRTGPVHAAVREAGYNDEDYLSSDVGEDEEEGSSVDESDVEHAAGEPIPSYSRPETDTIALTSGGYAVEKADAPAPIPAALGEIPKAPGSVIPSSTTDAAPAAEGTAAVNGDDKTDEAQTSMLGRFKEVFVGTPKGPASP